MNTFCTPNSANGCGHGICSNDGLECICDAGFVHDTSVGIYRNCFQTTTGWIATLGTIAGISLCVGAWAAVELVLHSPRAIVRKIHLTVLVGSFLHAGLMLARFFEGHQGWVSTVVQAVDFFFAASLPLVLIVRSFLDPIARFFANPLTRFRRGLYAMALSISLTPLVFFIVGLVLLGHSDQKSVGIRSYTLWMEVGVFLTGMHTLWILPSILYASRGMEQSIRNALRDLEQGGRTSRKMIASTTVSSSNNLETLSHQAELEENANRESMEKFRGFQIRIARVKLHTGALCAFFFVFCTVVFVHVFTMNFNFMNRYVLWIPFMLGSPLFSLAALIYTRVVTFDSTSSRQGSTSFMKRGSKRLYKSGRAIVQHVSKTSSKDSKTEDPVDSKVEILSVVNPPAGSVNGGGSLVWESENQLYSHTTNNNQQVPE